MQLIENLRLALTSLLANKMRALLTMLGIIIGISAVIMITTIGQSMQKTLSNTFNSALSMNYFYCYLSYTGDDYESFSMSDDNAITREMMDEIKERYGDHFMISDADDYGTASLTNTAGEIMSVNVTGTVEEAEEVTHYRGRPISYEDNMRKKTSIYVTDLFVRQYFKDGRDPIGETVTLNFENGVTADFTIVGYFNLSKIYDRFFPPGGKEIDRVTPVTVPVDTMRKLNHLEPVSSRYVTFLWNKDYDPKVLQAELQDYFDEKFKEKPDITVEVENEQQTVDMFNTVINVITIAISVIAAISLIVGGVGVMNIMLVSITERTKEIGIRKALGAQNSAIRMQFVIEAIMICLIGGIIGILLGITGGLLFGWVAKILVNQLVPDYAEFIAITVQPSIPAILIAVAFSILTGVFFGYYPANKAAKMDPIDALRYD